MYDLISKISAPTVIIGLVSALLPYIINKKSIDNNKFQKKDNQTEWVPRLVKVACKSKNQFGEEDILEILSCLRPVKNSVTSNKNCLSMWDIFTDKSIDLCNKIRNRRNKNDEIKKISIDNYNKFILITNTLLKNHWESLESDNKHFFLKKIRNFIRSDIFNRKTLESKYKEKKLNPIFAYVNKQI